MLTTASSISSVRREPDDAARRLADEAQGRADAAREVKDWHSADAAYAAAVEACRRFEPARAGALSVQRGHSLKELQRFEDAELCYRDGTALGAGADAFEHLTFVARRAGWAAEIYPGVGGAASGIAPVPSRRLVTRWDAHALLRLFLPDASLSDTAILGWLRQAPTLDDLIAAMMRDSRFAAGNARLLNAAARGERAW